MKNREPFVLRRPMLIYNILMVIINGIVFYETAIHINYGREFLNFEFPQRTDYSLRTLRIINIGYYYYLSKFLDLFDTIVFVLRKKTNQITFLHLYHHTAVPILGWLAIKLAPMAPPLFMFVLLNSFVHIVMYCYYALAAFGPKIQKYLWWKKYITQLQLTQFAIFISYGILLAFKQTGYPVIWFWIGLYSHYLITYLLVFIAFHLSQNLNFFIFSTTKYLCFCDLRFCSKPALLFDVLRLLCKRI